MSLFLRRGQSSALRTTTMMPGRIIAPAGEDDSADNGEDDCEDDGEDDNEDIDGEKVLVTMMVLVTK